MARYHVSEDGTPRVCTAQSSESCTARGVDGGSAPHGEFTDAGEARRFAESVLEESALGDGLSGESKAPASSAVGDRTAFTTDMADEAEYRVEGGRLKGELEGDSFDFGELEEISKEDADRWSSQAFGEKVSLQDGEIFPVFDDYGNDGTAYARFGDKYYVAMTNELHQEDEPAVPEKPAIRPAWLANDLRESLADYQRPHRTEARKREIEEFWSANGISSPEDAQARATELQAQVDRDHSNRIAAIGQDREADRARFQETSEALNRMNASLDLGSRIQPDYSQISKEHRLLAQSLGEEVRL